MSDGKTQISLTELKALIKFFRGIEIPSGPVILGMGETIINPSKMINSNLRLLAHIRMHKSSIPYYHRLLKIKAILS